MLDEIAQQGVRETIFIGPLGVTKDAVKRLRVRLLNAPQGGLECLLSLRARLASGSARGLGTRNFQGRGRPPRLP